MANDANSGQDMTATGDAVAFKLKQAKQVAESNGYANEPAIVAAILQALSASAQTDAIERAVARLERSLTSGSRSQPNAT